MSRTLKLFIIFCIFYSGCAHTLTAPLKPLKESESKHTFYSMGYQYQRGISDDVEIGLDLIFPYLGGNLRYHLNNNEKSLNSIQFGLDLSGVITNYMYTYKTEADTYIRFGPHLSYQFESKNWEGSEKSYQTIRFGCSFTYGGSHWWFTLGYSHPVYKNYGDVRWRPFSSGMEKLLYGNPIFSPEFKFGYSF